MDTETKFFDEQGNEITRDEADKLNAQKKADQKKKFFNNKIEGKEKMLFDKTVVTK